MQLSTMQSLLTIVIVVGFPLCNSFRCLNYMYIILSYYNVFFLHFFCRRQWNKVVMFPLIIHLIVCVLSFDKLNLFAPLHYAIAIKTDSITHTHTRARCFNVLPASNDSANIDNIVCPPMQKKGRSVTVYKERASVCATAHISHWNIFTVPVANCISMFHLTF